MDSFYEYMHILASCEVNALIIAPSDPRNILLDVKDEFHSHPRLSLSNDLDMIIWVYYSIMHKTPTVMEDFLIIILSILLINRSLQTDL